MKKTVLLAVLLVSTFAFAQQPAGGSGGQRPQAPPDNRPGMDQVRQARDAARKGDADQAISLFQQALQTNPQLMEAETGIGTILDLEGKYDDARKHLANAIELAKPEQKVGALKSLAMSYAFQKNCKDATRYEQQAFDSQMAATPPDYIAAAETADELARICIESGDYNAAEKWYKTGHDTAFKKADLTDAEKDLWNFRWEHAQARLAARRGKKAEAQKHVAAAKAIIDRGVIDKAQAAFLPYLVGYVAFYTGDYKTAIDQLQQANQRDPFILVLLAQAYEKSGQKDQAMDLYKKVLTFNVHNPTGAFSRPLAKEKVGAGS
jgi:tetratricopeptide (TPR) repeat protein